MQTFGSVRHGMGHYMWAEYLVMMIMFFLWDNRHSKFELAIYVFKLGVEKVEGQKWSP